MTTCMAGRRAAIAWRRPATAGRRPAVAGRRPAVAGRRPGRYRGIGRRLMPLGPVGLLGRIPPAPVAASTGGGPGVEGARYRSSRWQAAIGCGGIAVALALLLSFRGQRPLWWDPTKRKARAPGIRPKAQRGCPKEPQTYDQRGDANAPHQGHVRRADLPSPDPVVHDEETLAGATPSPRVDSAREPGFSEVRCNSLGREILRDYSRSPAASNACALVSYPRQWTTFPLRRVNTCQAWLSTCAPVSLPRPD